MDFLLSIIEGRKGRVSVILAGIFCINICKASRRGDWLNKQGFEQEKTENYRVEREEKTEKYGLRRKEKTEKYRLEREEKTQKYRLER